MSLFPMKIAHFPAEYVGPEWGLDLGSGDTVLMLLRAHALQDSPVGRDRPCQQPREGCLPVSCGRRASVHFILKLP